MIALCSANSASSAVIRIHPSSGFSGGGGTSRKSFFRPVVGRDIREEKLSRMIGGGKLFCVLGAEGLLCFFALKIRRKNERRINAKIAIRIHDSIAFSPFRS